MANNYDYIAIVNAINKQMSGYYAYEFPVVDSSNFKAMAAAFLNAPQSVKNAYIDTLTNVMFNVAIKKVYTASNPFRKLYQGDITPAGDGNQYVEEVSIDQFIPLAYEITSTPDDYFKSAPPKVKVQYLCNVLRKKYLVSINQDVIAPAFNSLGQFGSFWESVLSRLYADMEEDDKEEIIAAIEAVISGGNMFLLPITRPVDSPTALAFSKELDVLSRDLSFRRSRAYNLQHLSTKTPEDEAIIIIAGDVIATQNNYNLAWAFNRSYLDLMNKGQIIALDSNGLCDNRVFGVYTDTDYFRIHNVEGFPKIREWSNGANLEDRRWLHSWKMVNFSYASNAIAFAEKDDIGIDKVDLLDKDGNNTGTVKKGKFIQLDNPKIEATSGKLADSFGTYTITGANDVNTRVDQDGTVYISEDETATQITVTFTSHLDENVFGQYAITVD